MRPRGRYDAQGRANARCPGRLADATTSACTHARALLFDAPAKLRDKNMQRMLCVWSSGEPRMTSQRQPADDAAWPLRAAAQSLSARQPNLHVKRSNPIATIWLARTCTRTHTWILRYPLNAARALVSKHAREGCAAETLQGGGSLWRAGDLARVANILTSGD